MPSTTFSGDPAPAAPSFKNFQLYKKLPLRLKDRAYSFLLTGEWTSQSPALINELKEIDYKREAEKKKGASLYLAALAVMTQTYDFVLSPRNDYQVGQYPQDGLKDVKKVRIEFKLIDHPSGKPMTFNIFPNGNSVLPDTPSFLDTLLPFTNLEHLTLDTSFIVPDERAWYDLLRNYVLKYPKLQKVTLIRDLNQIFIWQNNKLTGVPSSYAEREPEYAPDWKNFYFIGREHYAVPRGEINRRASMTPDHLLIERLNRVFGFPAMLDIVSYDDHEVWTWTFVPGRYEGDEGLTWVDSLIDRSGAWDENVYFDTNTDVSECFTINAYTRFMSAMNPGSIYWVKEGYLESVNREGLKGLGRDELEELLLTEREECDSDLDEIVDSVEVEEYVEVEGEEEMPKKRKRKDKSYVRMLAAIYAAEEKGEVEGC